MSTKSNGQKDPLDKFYTKQEVVQRILSDITPHIKNKLILEPSAGDGAFYKEMLKHGDCVAFDISPEHPNIIKQDYLSLSQDMLSKHNPKSLPVCIIGNPPFGESSKLAFQFLHHSMTLSNTVGFILPLSFKKVSHQNKIIKANPYFHIVHEYTLPPNSFLFDGQTYDVGAVFQLYVKKPNTRKPHKTSTKSKYLAFTTPELADFSVRRVGGSAGRASWDKSYSTSSNYFVKIKDPLDKQLAFQSFEKLVFPTISYTVGPKSLPKSELVVVFDEYWNDKL